jgi:hypothetical protein
VQLQAASEAKTIILCQEATNGRPATVTSTLQPDIGAGVDVPANACVVGAGAQTPPAPPVHIGLTSGTLEINLRSTLAVIQYIGRILAFQEEQTHAHPELPERCITVNFVPLTQATCSGTVLFRLEHTPSPTEIGLDYDGAYWAVPARRSCTGQANCDFSLESIAMISLLLNQNKSAKDIASTPAFQAVP